MFFVKCKILLQKLDSKIHTKSQPISWFYIPSIVNNFDNESSFIVSLYTLTHTHTHLSGRAFVDQLVGISVLSRQQQKNVKIIWMLKSLCERVYFG